MGKIKQGILGGFSGKVANVIGGSWKGIAYMRSLPLSVSQPNTAAQQQQKSKFSWQVQLAKLLLLTYIHPLWNRLAVQMSGYNFFIQQNPNVVDDTGLVDPAMLVFSPGSNTGASLASITATNGNTVVAVNWMNNAGTGTALATDIAYALVYNETQNSWALQIAPAVRSDESADCDLDIAAASGDTIYAWLAFKSADGLKISEYTSNSVVVA